MFADCNDAEGGLGGSAEDGVDRVLHVDCISHVDDGLHVSYTV